MSTTRETVTCFEHQPESWYRTVNTLDFDRPFVEEVDPPGVMSNPPGPGRGEPEPPYGGRYSYPRPTRVRGSRVVRFLQGFELYAAFRMAPR